MGSLITQGSMREIRRSVWNLGSMVKRESGGESVIEEARGDEQPWKLKEGRMRGERDVCEETESCSGVWGSRIAGCLGV